MNIFTIFTLCGGIALFLYGIILLSNSLESLAGGKMEKLLHKATSNPFKALLLGLGITATIQSSSAVTVMLVGLVNSGIMELNQTIGVIMGSNIGTTITAWILSLSGIESSNFFVKLFKPESFSPVLAMIGVILIMQNGSRKKKSIGGVMVGFAILMFGMGVLTNTLAPFADNPEVSTLLTAFSNPILGILAGTLITVLVQSSSASVGILQAMSIAGGITYANAMPIIMGQNLGTCASSLISAIGVSTNAKRVALIHTMFNIFGIIIFCGIFAVVGGLYDLNFLNNEIGPFKIAILHTIFNLVATIALFPFIKILEKLAIKIVKDTNQKEIDFVLDDRLLKVPSIAITDSCTKIMLIGKLIKENILTIPDIFVEYNPAKIKDTLANISNVRKLENSLNNYLLKISSIELSEKDGKKVTQLLSSMSEFEGINECIDNLVDLAGKLSEKDNNLTPEAKAELNVTVEAILEMYEISLNAISKDDVKLATDVEAIDEVVNMTAKNVKERYIQRLKEGKANVEVGFIFLDIISVFRRIAFRCVNIATAVMQMLDDNIDKFNYKNRDKKEDKEFTTKYDNYQNRFKV